MGYESYVSSIKSALSAALCLRDFPSTLFEKDNKPYIELTGYTPKVDSLILKPIYLARNKREVFLIEPSINSCRISFTVKKSDEIDKLIAGKFSGMLAARAEFFELVRRKPIEVLIHWFRVSMLLSSSQVKFWRSTIRTSLLS